MRYTVLIVSLGKDTLLKAIRSILACDAKDFEIVLIIDNPNYDIEKQLLDKLPSDSRRIIEYSQNPKNIGITKSLNIGLAMSRGEYIMRLDDDDQFTPYRFSKSDDIINSVEDVDIITGAAIITEKKFQSKYITTIPVDHHHIVSALEKRNILIHSCLTIKKDSLKELGGYDERYYYAQDYALYLAAIRKGYRFMGISTPMVERYEGLGSISTDKRRHQALFSLAALSLHHALTWDDNFSRIKKISMAFLRFSSPSCIRSVVRFLRRSRHRVKFG